MPDVGQIPLAHQTWACDDTHLLAHSFCHSLATCLEAVGANALGDHKLKAGAALNFVYKHARPITETEP